MRRGRAQIQIVLGGAFGIVIGLCFLEGFYFSVFPFHWLLIFSFLFLRVYFVALDTLSHTVQYRQTGIGNIS